MSEEKHQQEFSFPKETMLELVQLEEGQIVLRQAVSEEAGADDSVEPLVSIQFSEQVKDMLGDDLKGIGQHMIHSAIQLVMQRQIASWHANVVDEEPVRYS